MPDTGDRTQLLPKEIVTVFENDKYSFGFDRKSYDNNTFHIQDRDVYHQKFQNQCNHLSVSDSHIYNYNNFMSYDEKGKCVDFGLTVGQVETDTMNNFDTNQFHNGFQYLHACKQYSIDSIYESTVY